MRSSRLNSEGLVITRPAEQRAPELERKARRERRSQGSWLLPGKSSSRLPANAKRDTHWLFPHGVLHYSYILAQRGGKKTGKSLEMVPHPEQVVIPSVLEGALVLVAQAKTESAVPKAQPTWCPWLHLHDVQARDRVRQPIPSDVSDYALTARQSKSPEPAPATANSPRSTRRRASATLACTHRLQHAP